MKKFLAILLCMILLVSCATKKTPLPDFPGEATVGETIEVVDLEFAAVSEDVASVEEETPESPATVEELVEVEELLVDTEDSEDIIVEDVVIEDILDEEAADSTDDIGSFVFSETAPEVPEIIESVEAESVHEEPVAESTVEELVVVPVANVQVPVSQTSIPESELSFVDKLSAFVQKTGSFIVREKLLSVGLLTIFVGIVYLIIALIKTSDRHRRHEEYFDSDYEEESEYDAFSAHADAPEQKKARAKVDLDLSSDDDEFLRNLLGEDVR